MTKERKPWTRKKPYVKPEGSGRPIGYKVSEEVKDAVSATSATAIAVTTPLGEFHSIREAAKAHNIGAYLMGWYCAMGERQRNGEWLVHGNTGKPQKDYTGYIRHGKGLSSEQRQRRVKTPAGEFDRIVDAAKHYSVTPAAIIHKIKHKKEGWEYI